MELKFETKVWETGNVNVVTIPKAFIKHGLLNPANKYEFIIREVADRQEGSEKVILAPSKYPSQFASEVERDARKGTRDGLSGVFSLNPVSLAVPA